MQLVIIIKRVNQQRRILKAADDPDDSTGSEHRTFRSMGPDLQNWLPPPRDYKWKPGNFQKTLTK